MRRQRAIDSEPPRHREYHVRHRNYETPVPVEAVEEAHERMRLKAEAKQIVARALAKGWAKMGGKP